MAAHGKRRQKSCHVLSVYLGRSLSNTGLKLVVFLPKLVRDDAHELTFARKFLGIKG